MSRFARSRCFICGEDVAVNCLQRHYKYHHPDEPFPLTKYGVEHFNRHVLDDGGCTIWTGLLHRGYGQFRWNYKNHRAHRWIYEAKVGPIPGGYQIDHLCRNTRCVKLSHLEAVTPRANTLRSTAPSALNALKTHCPKGHAYAIFAYHRPDGGGRNCSECVRVSSREYQRRKAQERRKK